IVPLFPEYFVEADQYGSRKRDAKSIPIICEAAGKTYSSGKASAASCSRIFRHARLRSLSRACEKLRSQGPCSSDGGRQNREEGLIRHLTQHTKPAAYYLGLSGGKSL